MQVFSPKMEPELFPGQRICVSRFRLCTPGPLTSWTCMDRLHQLSPSDAKAQRLNADVCAAHHVCEAETSHDVGCFYPLRSLPPWYLVMYVFRFLYEDLFYSQQC